MRPLSLMTMVSISIFPPTGICVESSCLSRSHLHEPSQPWSQSQVTRTTDQASLQVERVGGAGREEPVQGLPYARRDSVVHDTFSSGAAKRTMGKQPHSVAESYSPWQQGPVHRMSVACSPHTSVVGGASCCGSASPHKGSPWARAIGPAGNCKPIIVRGTLLDTCIT
jgi:hypothetical protein